MPTIQLKVNGANYDFGWKQRTVTVAQAQKFVHELTPERQNQLTIIKREHEYNGVTRTVKNSTRITAEELARL